MTRGITAEIDKIMFNHIFGYICFMPTWWCRLTFLLPSENYSMMTKQPLTGLEPCCTRNVHIMFRYYYLLHLCRFMTAQAAYFVPLFIQPNMSGRADNMPTQSGLEDSCRGTCAYVSSCVCKWGILQNAFNYQTWLCLLIMCQWR